MTTETKTLWKIDPTHSEVQFKVKHLVIPTVTVLFFESDKIMLNVINGGVLSDQATHQTGSMKQIFHNLQSEPATTY